MLFCVKRGSGAQITVSVLRRWLARLGGMGIAILAPLLADGRGLAEEASLEVPPSVEPGVVFEAGWQGPDAPGDFIAIARPEAPAADFIAYARTSQGSPSVLTAPGAGEYELRYVLAGRLSILATAALRVADAPGLTAQAEIEPGADIVVTVAEPGAPADFVTIVPSGADEQAIGAYTRLRGARRVSLEGPERPGAYEIRQVRAEDLTVVERAPVEVRTTVGPETAGPPARSGGTDQTETASADRRTAGGAGVRLMALPAVDRSRTFRVAWEGRDGDGDRIAIVPPGDAPDLSVASRPTQDGSSVRFTAPEAPGNYEILYVDGASADVLAVRPLEVR